MDLLKSGAELLNRSKVPSEKQFPSIPEELAGQHSYLFDIIRDHVIDWDEDKITLDFSRRSNTGKFVLSRAAGSKFTMTRSK
jgi:hypothetical protein